VVIFDSHNDFTTTSPPHHLTTPLPD
jgi:hypothetical protein